MIFIDANVFVSAFCEEEENHLRAKEIFLDIHETGETIATSDHVLDETITLMRRRYGANEAFLNAQKILKSETEIFFCVPDDIEPALQLLKKYGSLSFCDALSATMMQKKGIRKIFSFDSDFDKIPGIKRLC